MAFAEFEGGFEGFEEAGVVTFGGFEAVLDDGDLGGEGFARVGVGGVGAVGFGEDVDAKVALGLEEGEEFGGLGFGGDGDREGDEEVLVGEVSGDVIGDGLWGGGADGIAGFGVVAGDESWEEEF